MSSSPASLETLNRKVAAECVPASGSIDLTHRCNLTCVHCYLTSRRSPAGHRQTGPPELDTHGWLSLIDQIAAAGCLSLIITGGEPLLRQDFGKIYTHIKERGIMTTVYTNGTLVTDDHLALFRDLPPAAVEISLYGATQATYENVTGVPGSWSRCLEGIEKLSRLDLDLTLKTVLLEQNLHEFAQIEELSRRFGARYRYDPNVFPEIDGGKSPLACRIPAKKFVEAEFSNPEVVRRWKKYIEKLPPPPPKSEALTCMAGVTYFHVTPDGHLQRCMILKDPAIDLTTHSFIEGWRTIVDSTREKAAALRNRCGSCDMQDLCGFCPGLFELETGSAGDPPEHLCEIGKARRAAIAAMPGKTGK